MSDEHSEYKRLILPMVNQMIRSIWRIVRDPDDAEDAFQDALVTTWKRLRRICRHPNPPAVILRICANAAYDVLRKKARQRRHEAIEVTPADFPDSAPSAAEHLSRREEQTEIFQAISVLPRNQAQAVLMRFVQELSYQEIAQALGCSEPAARKQISRARARLRSLLAHLAPYPPKEVPGR